MNKNKKLGFTLAEVLIVIGIIGVVAALTLPNLNHATGDKETVTRLKKAYSILSEANDRAVAIYGPISSWFKNSVDSNCDVYLMRIGEFLKISKSCNSSNSAQAAGTDTSCDSFVEKNHGEMSYDNIFYQLPDGITVSAGGSILDNCNATVMGYDDICITELYVDVNSLNKGANLRGQDMFVFAVSESKGLIPYRNVGNGDIESQNESCIYDKSEESCTFWVLEYENLDYLKTDDDAKCPNGTQLSATQTSCN